MAANADIAIVGAGAAGLAAAIFAAEAAPPGTRIQLLEGAGKVGAKILVSGGGRCNVTNAVVRPEDFHGTRPVIRNVLAAFGAGATRSWFAALGVELREEDNGKLFPVSGKARTVLDALLGRCRTLGVHLRCGVRVHSVERTGNLFSILGGAGPIVCAAQLVLATGGRSLPRTGSDGSGWELAARLGHTISPTYPALVPLVLDDRCFHAELSGISLDVELSTFNDARLADRRRGRLLWTHFGISGPVVMDASRFWVMAHSQNRPASLRCNFFPGETFATTEAWLTSSARSRPRLNLRRLLSERLTARFAEALLLDAGVDPAQPTAQLSRDRRRDLVHRLTDFELPVLRARGWDFAEVTAGGVPLEEIDYRSMESRRVPQLYLIGEMLDCDGRIGGFNFQWAWATGSLAGKSAATRLRDP
jgi:predicted Rossmann fold flavoprotein